MKNHRSASVLTADSASHSPLAVVERLTQAQNAHDADAMAACFTADYDSQQPAHPKRAFRGADRVRENWVEVFENIPDLHAEILRATVDGDTVWAEIHWFGHKRDGSPFALRGVTMSGVSGGKIAWGRLYVEPVEHSGESAMTAIQRTTS